MLIMKRPTSIFDDLYGSLTSMFNDDYFTKNKDMWRHDNSISVENEKDKYIYSLNLPGYAPDEVEITTTDSLVNIIANKGLIKGNNSSFEWRFDLPSDAEDTSITAELKYGVLKLTAAKRKDGASKPRRVVVSG